MVLSVKALAVSKSENFSEIDRRAKVIDRNDVEMGDSTEAGPVCNREL